MMTFLGLCHAFLSHKVGLRDKSKELLHGLDITIGVLIYTSFQTCMARVRTGGAGREKGGGAFFSPFLSLFAPANCIFSGQCVC